MKVLYLNITLSSKLTIEDSKSYKEKYLETEYCLEKHLKIQELDCILFSDEVECNQVKEMTKDITCSVIRGVTRNKSITSFSVRVLPLPDGSIECLLKDNHTIQALSLIVPDNPLLSPLNIVEVNTPLRALSISNIYYSNKLTTSLLPHFKGLQNLSLFCKSLSPSLLFQSHPSLVSLSVESRAIYPAAYATQLFIILQFNTTLKGLRMAFNDEKIFSKEVCTNL